MSENYNSEDYEIVTEPNEDLSDIRLELVYDEKSGDVTLLDPEIEENMSKWLTLQGNGSMDEENVYDLEEWR